MTELYVSLAAVGGLLLVLGLLGGLLKERTPVSEPLIALLAGVLIGPAAFGLLDLADLSDRTAILEEATLVTLGVALVAFHLLMSCHSPCTLLSPARYLLPCPPSETPAHLGRTVFRKLGGPSPDER